MDAAAGSAEAGAVGEGARKGQAEDEDSVRRASAALSVEWLGCVPYAEALARQEAALRDRAAGRTGDRLLLLEHPPVITLGRNTRPGHLLLGEATLRERGIERFEVARGGDVTYHAPGQLVGYPIVDLSPPHRRDVHAFLRALEMGLIEALESLSIPACRVEGRTGVFVDLARSRHAGGPARKLASIGIGLRHWVTWHGFALNVDLDLAGFDAIVPCGLADVVMTSVARELAIEGGPGIEGDRAVEPRRGWDRERARSVGDADGERELGTRVREAVVRALVERLSR